MVEHDSDELRQFGANLRRLREAAGYSQDGFAREVGVHKNFVGGVERGEMNVSLLNIVQFARQLDATIADLVDGIH